MKNGRFYVWMALLVASTFILISTTKDATADPFKRLAPIKGYSQVFSLTGPPLVGRFLIIRAVPIGWGSGRCLRLMPL